MTEQERIEGINSEQLATATDRVLLAARFGRARPSSSNLYARASSPQFARGSSPRIEPARCYVPQTDAPVYTPPAQRSYVPATDAPVSTPPARGSAAEIDHARSAAHAEQTLFIRAPKHERDAWRRFATISLLTSLASVTAAILLLV